MAGLPVHPRLAHMMLRGDMLGLADQACALAALLSDRDFMRGRGADLRLRVEAILNRQAPKMIGEAAKQLSRRLKVARNKVDLTGDKGRVDRADQVGLLLAFAYPDRIGERRKGQDARYRLSGGRGGVLPNGDGLAAEPYIAVAELDGQAREAKIYLAAPLSRATLETHFADQITEGTEVFWDAQSSAVQARWQRRIGALVLDEKPPMTQPIRRRSQRR